MLGDQAGWRRRSSAGSFRVSPLLHVVVEMHADIAAAWSAEAVAERWLGLYPPEDGQYEPAKAMIVGNDARVAVLRSRLCSLSWFMKSLSEPIARWANAEDHCKGRFWEGRFRSHPSSALSHLISPYRVPSRCAGSRSCHFLGVLSAKPL